MIVIVMGVAGSGKSTIGERLARRLGWTFLDGDTYHSPDSIAKMRAGEALTDEDRRPWLDALARLVRDAREEQRPVVLASSALKRAYRDTLTSGRRDDVLLVHLTGDEALIRVRMQSRDHFMPPASLGSQFATLEPPDEDERPCTFDVHMPPEEIVDAIVAELSGRQPREASHR